MKQMAPNDNEMAKAIEICEALEKIVVPKFGNIFSISRNKDGTYHFVVNHNGTAQRFIYVSDIHKHI